eukprot:TRINITY_DN16200_c0_g1_i1.p1 TRINITY_DN16200_c0_g1~~TRINITY_DN16200_c0_g1_i1.p1  ORF type:complete len:195 (+),score=30.86 TRINITY_DN16200_c0_g1_i1:167-751(+)
MHPIGLGTISSPSECRVFGGCFGGERRRMSGTLGTAPTLTFPASSKVLKDAMEVYGNLFKHNLQPDIQYTLHEFEQKRGDKPIRDMREAAYIIKTATDGLDQAKDLVNKQAPHVMEEIATTVQVIRAQLSKHTVVLDERERLMHAWAIEEEKQKGDWLLSQDQERRRLDREYENSVIGLEAKYKVLSTTLEEAI